MQRVLPLLALALVIGASGHAQEGASPGLAKVVSIVRMDIDATIGAPRSSAYFETGRGDPDGRIFVSESYNRIEVQPSTNPNGSYLFYRDVPTKVSDVTARYSDSQHDALKNQELDLPVQIVDYGDGVRLFFGDPRSTETQNVFTLYLSYTMIPTVRFGVSEVADEFHWLAVANEWEAPIDNVTVVCAVRSRADSADLDSFSFEARYTLGNEDVAVNASTLEAMHAQSNALEADMEAGGGKILLTAWAKSRRSLAPNESIGLAMTVPTGVLNPASAAVLAPRFGQGLGLPSLGGAGVGIGLIIYFALASTLFVLTSGWIFFVKARQPGWASIIPYYNTYILLLIAGKPWWWLLIYLFVPLIPIVGIIVVLVVYVLHALALAQCFGKGTGFAVGLIVLPFIFFPLLAFGDAQYEGPDWATLG